MPQRLHSALNICSRADGSPRNIKTLKIFLSVTACTQRFQGVINGALITFLQRLYGVFMAFSQRPYGALKTFSQRPHGALMAFSQRPYGALIAFSQRPYMVQVVLIARKKLLQRAHGVMRTPRQCDCCFNI